MIALNQKDLHVHSPFCPHRASDAPLEEYLTAAEKQGIVELGFAEHGPFPAPLSLTQYTKHPIPGTSPTFWRRPVRTRTPTLA